VPHILEEPPDAGPEEGLETDDEQEHDEDDEHRTEHDALDVVAAQGCAAEQMPEGGGDVVDELFHICCYWFGGVVSCLFVR